MTLPYEYYVTFNLSRRFPTPRVIEIYRSYLSLTLTGPKVVLSIGNRRTLRKVYLRGDLTTLYSE